MAVPRGLYSTTPPNPRTWLENNPTLLFSWWCTGCAVTIILFRVSGRKIRNNRLFREDKIMALSIIPLLIRMALIHPVLVWGNNNVNTAGLSAEDIYHRSIGSRLVLGARIFYALFIWIAKFTVSEYLKRLFSSFWTKGSEAILRAIRAFLVVSFIAVLIATLSECHPFDHYWQVVPDPGPHCRQAYAQLITMGAADIITDILLIVFPLPMVIKSHLQLSTKIRLILLFGLSTVLIAITAYRIPSVIAHESVQQYRTVWASGEILGAAAVSNAIVLGSFLRDRGLKKAKYRPDRYNSTSESENNAGSARRPTILQQRLGDDDDVFHDMCYRTEHEDEERAAPRAPPLADAATPSQPTDMSCLRDPKWHQSHSIDDSARESEESEPDPKKAVPLPESRPRDRRVSFFDVGGLLAPDDPSQTPSSRPFLPDLTFPSLLSPRSARPSSTDETSIELARSPSNRSADQYPLRGILRKQETTVSLQDVGGLLGPMEEVPEEGGVERLEWK